MAAFDPGELDDGWLRTLLRREGAEGAYDALRALAAADYRPVDVDALERLLDELRRPRDGRADVTGMTRPPRDADERVFLAARGRLGPFGERANADSPDASDAPP